MPHVTVIGGGITGLVSAFRLSQHPGVEVTLLEARSGVGGKINTIDLEGARVELGPDSFLVRDEGALQLFRDIGLESELVEPQDFGAWIYRAGRLRRFPIETVLGFPAGPGAVIRSEVLSPLGKVRALMETLCPKTLTGPDVSVGRFARVRFGTEVHDRLVDPLLPRIRAGNLDEMSLAAALPQIDRIARSNRSVLLALTANRGSARPPTFYAPAGGMHRVVEALEDAAPTVEVRRSSPVRAISGSSTGYKVELDNETLETDGVVVAAPAYAAAKVLQDLSPEASRVLSEIPHAASAVINLIFPDNSVRPPSGGSGILIPTSERMTLAGCTWSSAKWPALAAPDRQTVRCFVVHDNNDPAIQLSDRDLAGVVLEELRRIVEVSSEPVASHVARWKAGLPVYQVGHLERVARIESALNAFRGIEIAGASYRGSGIPDCIAQAEAASARLISAVHG